MLKTISRMIQVRRRPPYLYRSPTYMVFFLYCLGVERPSASVTGCILGISLFTAVASAGEVNFHLVRTLPPLHGRLQPHAPQPAALCTPGCSPL